MSHAMNTHGNNNAHGAHGHHKHQHAHNAVSTTLKGGKLCVQGTDGKDDLSIKKVGDNVEVMNGDKVIGTFPADQVKSVELHGHKGNDKLDVDVGQDIKVKVLGGRGNDNTTVENAKDAFVGGVFGKDTINLKNSVGTKIHQGKKTDIINAMGAFDAAPASTPACEPPPFVPPANQDFVRPPAAPPALPALPVDSVDAPRVVQASVPGTDCTNAWSGGALPVALRT